MSMIPEWLLSASADEVYKLVRESETPFESPILHKAARRNELDVIQHILDSVIPDERYALLMVPDHSYPTLVWWLLGDEHVLSIISILAYEQHSNAILDIMTPLTKRQRFDILTTSKFGRLWSTTVLHIAARCGNANLIKMIFKGDWLTPPQKLQLLRAKNTRGETAVDIAKEESQWEVQHYLKYHKEFLEQITGENISDEIGGRGDRDFTSEERLSSVNSLSMNARESDQQEGEVSQILQNLQGSIEELEIRCNQQETEHARLVENYTISLHEREKWIQAQQQTEQCIPELSKIICSRTEEIESLKAKEAKQDDINSEQANKIISLESNLTVQVTKVEAMEKLLSEQAAMMKLMKTVLNEQTAKLESMESRFSAQTAKSEMQTALTESFATRFDALDASIESQNTSSNTKFARQDSKFARVELDVQRLSTRSETLVMNCEDLQAVQRSHEQNFSKIDESFASAKTYSDSIVAVSGALEENGLYLKGQNLTIHKRVDEVAECLELITPEADQRLVDDH